MYKLGIIEESIHDPDTIEKLKKYFFSQRIEEVPGDTSPIWHTNEYHIEEKELFELLPVLEEQIKLTWYIHAFNDKQLIVIMKGKSFRISLHKDETWESMIEYGEKASVEKHYLENIPLHI